MKSTLASWVPSESAVINPSHYFAASSNDPLWWFDQPLRADAYSYLCAPATAAHVPAPTGVFLVQ